MSRFGDDEVSMCPSQGFQERILTLYLKLKSLALRVKCSSETSQAAIALISLEINFFIPVFTVGWFLQQSIRDMPFSF